MSWVGSEPWDLYLGSQAGAMSRDGLPVVWQSYTDLEAGLAQMLETAALRRSRWARPGIRLWLSGAMARPFLIEPPQGLKGAAELKALAQARAFEMTGLGGACEVCVNDSSSARRQLVVAMRAQTHSALVAVSAAARCRVFCIRPWWALALDVVLQRQPDLQMLTVDDTDSATLLSAPEDDWEAANSYWPAPKGGQLDALVARTKLSSTVSNPKTACVSLGAEAQTRWPMVVNRLQGGGT